jgi:hypothetical protein
MIDAHADFRAELERIRRVADMLCSAHAGLHDMYTRLALIAELITLAASTWLVALVFVEPRINIRLTPLGFEPQIWIGLLSSATLFLTIVQVRTDWRGKADAHARSLAMYAEVKRGCGYLLASGTSISQAECQRLLARYDVATDFGVKVPESAFLKYKRRHLAKVAISKHLDAHPGTSILLFRWRLWRRDNWSKKTDHSAG